MVETNVHWRLLVACLLFACLGTSAARGDEFVVRPPSVSVVPMQPRANERVTAVVDFELCDSSIGGVVAQDGRFSILIQRPVDGICFFSVGWQGLHADVQLGRLAAGHYVVEVIDDHASPLFSPVISEFDVLPAHEGSNGARVATDSYAGLWWNPQHEGEGVFVDDQHGNMLVGWLTFGAMGEPIWYTLQGTRTDATHFFATVYRTNGPPSAQFRQITQAVGTAQIVFQTERADFTFVLYDGRSGAIPIQRFHYP